METLEQEIATCEQELGVCHERTNELKAKLSNLRDQRELRQQAQLTEAINVEMKSHPDVMRAVELFCTKVWRSSERIRIKKGTKFISAMVDRGYHGPTTLCRVDFEGNVRTPLGKRIRLNLFMDPADTWREKFKR